jgi:hypothetical protein
LEQIMAKDEKLLAFGGAAGLLFGLLKMLSAFV